MAQSRCTLRGVAIQRVWLDEHICEEPEAGSCDGGGQRALVGAVEPGAAPERAEVVTESLARGHEWGAPGVTPARRRPRGARAGAAGASSPAPAARANRAG